jgi:hypothetical protein
MRDQYLTKLTNRINPKILWWGSLSIVLVLLLGLRYLFHSQQSNLQDHQRMAISVKNTALARHNTDLYIAAIQAQKLNDAIDILLHKPLDETYLNQRITTKIPQASLSCGLQSAVTVGMQKRDFSDGVGVYTLCNTFLTKGARPTESTLVAALDNLWSDVAVRCLNSGVKGEGVSGATPPILTVTTMLMEERYDTHYETDLYKSCLDLLLQHQVNLNCQDSKGNTPLHLLIENHKNMYNVHYLDTLKEMLHQNNAKKAILINTKNNLGQTALHIALANLEDGRYIGMKISPNTRVLAYLLEARANPNQAWVSGRSQTYVLDKIATEEENVSLLKWAKKNTHQNVVALLKQYGAKD